MFLKRFHRSAILGCVLIALGGVATGVALASGGVPRSARRPSSVDSARLTALRRATRRARERALLVKQGLLVLSGPSRQLPSSLQANFSVLRGASIARAHLATSGPEQFLGVPKDIVTTWGLAVGDTTQISNDVGLYIWLIPGASGTCLEWTNPAVAGSGGGDCVSNSKVAEGEFSPLIGLMNGEKIVIGLAPDGNRLLHVLSG